VLQNVGVPPKQLLELQWFTHFRHSLALILSQKSGVFLVTESGKNQQIHLPIRVFAKR
jgi:hypothetical protein